MNVWMKWSNVCDVICLTKPFQQPVGAGCHWHQTCSFPCSTNHRSWCKELVWFYPLVVPSFPCRGKLKAKHEETRSEKFVCGKISHLNLVWWAHHCCKLHRSWTLNSRMWWSWCHPHTLLLPHKEIPHSCLCWCRPKFLSNLIRETNYKEMTSHEKNNKHVCTKKGDPGEGLTPLRVRQKDCYMFSCFQLNNECKEILINSLFSKTLVWVSGENVWIFSVAFVIIPHFVWSSSLKPRHWSSVSHLHQKAIVLSKVDRQESDFSKLYFHCYSHLNHFTFWHSLQWTRFSPLPVLQSNWILPPAACMKLSLLCLHQWPMSLNSSQGRIR